jgi:hypothetical protein
MMNTILVYLKGRHKKVVYLDFIWSLKIHQHRIGDPRNRIHMNTRPDEISTGSLEASREGTIFSSVSKVRFRV